MWQELLSPIRLSHITLWLVSVNRLGHVHGRSFQIGWPSRTITLNHLMSRFWPLLVIVTQHSKRYLLLLKSVCLFCVNSHFGS